ncbi:MAG: DUF2240 family protein [Candidatus Natronoplasma sp.]
MKEELKRALAFLFQREGETVDKEDFIYIQSADLDWYSSDHARQLLNKGLEFGLIKVKDDSVIARFDFEDVDIPIGFEPSEEIFKEERKDIFPELLDLVSEKSGHPKQEIMSLVNEKQDKMNIEVKTALLLVAQEKEIEIEDEEEYIEKVSEEIRGTD